MKVLLIVFLTLLVIVAAVPCDNKRELTKEENDFVQNYRASISYQ